MQKFSKFQTAIASHYRDKCTIMPYWMEELDAESHGSAEQESPATKPRKPKAAPEQDKAPAEQAKAPAEQAKAPAPIIAPAATAPLDSTPPMRRRFTSPAAVAAPSTSEATSTKASGAPGPAKSTGLAQAAGGKKQVKTKVEPKTYFANERTFIQWLSTSVLLVTLSTAIMSINDTARIAGTIFFPVSIAKRQRRKKTKRKMMMMMMMMMLMMMKTRHVLNGQTRQVALIFMFYALGIYRWRLRKINNRDGTVRT